MQCLLLQHLQRPSHLAVGYLDPTEMETQSMDVGVEYHGTLTVSLDLFGELGVFVDVSVR